MDMLELLKTGMSSKHLLSLNAAVKNPEECPPCKENVEAKTADDFFKPKASHDDFFKN